MKSDKLSWYRTEHTFKNICYITCIIDYQKAIAYSRTNELKVYALGNGSNTFFNRSSVSTLVLINSLDKKIEHLDDDIFEVSSTVQIRKLLRILYNENRAAPYSLASVPATVGGAVAMNAGTGINKNSTICDFLISVTVWIDGNEFEMQKSELKLDYRSSIFSESTDYFIVKAKFEFPKIVINGDPIQERLEWSKENQDLKLPNCGSVWRRSNHKILKFIRFIYNGKHAWISSKSVVWISNESKSSTYVRRILILARVLHKLFFKKIDLEIRVVD